jgi:CheY-like chemotaxis protein
MAGGLAHDFNNILMGILGNLSMAMEDVEDGSDTQECLLQSILAAQKAAELTKQMLAYSGKGTFVPEDIDINSALNEMRGLVGPTLCRNADIYWDMRETLPPIRGDRAQLRQVILNLLTNASEAMEGRSGKINVSSGLEKCDARRQELLPKRAPGVPAPTALVYLRVGDSGCGISPENLPRVFDPFFSTKFPGRGLGLPAVQGIARALGGCVDLQSQEGRGTIVSVYFPALGALKEIRPAESIDVAGTERPRNLTGVNVMVVDDEEMVRSMAKRMLERAGAHVEIATDGLEGVELAEDENHPIDLVLLDMTMPRMDGEQTLDALHRKNPNLPVILSSGYSERQMADRFNGKGLAGFLQKPYQSKELIGKILEVMSKREA